MEWYMNELLQIEKSKVLYASEKMALSLYATIVYNAVSYDDFKNSLIANGEKRDNTNPLN